MNQKCIKVPLLFFTLASMPAFSQADDATAELGLMRHSIEKGDYYMAFEHSTVLTQAILGVLKEHPQTVEPAARQNPPTAMPEFLALADTIGKAIE